MVILTWFGTLVALLKTLFCDLGVNTFSFNVQLETKETTHWERFIAAFNVSGAYHWEIPPE